MRWDWVTTISSVTWVQPNCTKRKQSLRISRGKGAASTTNSHNLPAQRDNLLDLNDTVELRFSIVQSTQIWVSSYYKLKAINSRPSLHFIKTWQRNSLLSLDSNSSIYIAHKEKGPCIRDERLSQCSLNLHDNSKECKLMEVTSKYELLRSCPKLLEQTSV